MTKYDLDQKSIKLHWLVLPFSYYSLENSIHCWKWSSKGIFIESGDPFISFVNIRIIGSILSISSQEDWLYNLGKPLYSSQLCPLTNWQSHTVLLLLSLYNRNSSCSLLECPVPLLYFSFLFVFLSGSEPSVGGRGACWESHVPYVNIEGAVYTFHTWAIEPCLILKGLLPPTQATHLLTPVSKENRSAAAKQSQADCTSELFSTSTVWPDQILYRGNECCHPKEWFVD